MHKMTFSETTSTLSLDVSKEAMSQNKQSLFKIAKEAGLAGFLVRPLSAKLLPETIPQMKGWLSEKFLFDFEGRSRKPQIALAKKWDIKDYPWPAGDARGKF